MANLWGFAAGQQAAQEMAQRQQMANIATAEAPLQMQHMEIANKMSELALRQQEFFTQHMQAQMSRMTDGKQGGDPLANQMHDMAMLALDSGNPQMAAKYIDSYTNYERNKETIANNKNKLAIQHAKLIDSLMQNVHDQRSWAAANMSYMLETGQPSPFAHVPYEYAKQSGLLDRVQAATLNAVQKSQIQKNTAQARAADATAGLAPLRARLIERQTRESTVRTKHLEKEGVPTATKGLNDNLRMLTDLANKSYEIDPTRQAALRAILRPWAEKMAQQVKNHGDMSPSEAADMVFKEAKKAHAFAGFADFRGLPGGTPSNAIPYSGDPKSLQDNKWYMTNKGPLLYTKKGFVSQQEVQSEQLQ